MRKKQEKKTWYPLDNAGVLYSALQKERYSAVYRFSAVMTQTVDPLALQRAVQKTMPRFPTFGVRIRRGAFWCYFEPNPNPGPFVKKDMANPCQPIRFHEDNDWLIRIFYYEKRISLEVFHAISDGAGSIIFLRTLLAVYLRERGYDIPNAPGILDVNEPPRKEEREDAYGRYAGKTILRGPLEKTAFPNTSQAEPFYTLNVTMGLVPVDQIRAVARGYGATITEYLTAVLLKSLIENQAAKKFRHPQPVALAIPINLRPWFPSETLRNFILTMRPVVDPSLGEYTLEEIVSLVHHSMRLHANRQEMRAKLTGNVRFTKNKFLPDRPSGVKKSCYVLLVQAGGGAALFGDLHQSRTFSRSPGDGAAYSAHGSYAGPGNPTFPALRFHQLREYHGHHLCRNGRFQRDGASVLYPSGSGGHPRQSRV